VARAALREWGLSGAVGAEHFARLSEGQHPNTQEQLVRHQESKTYAGKNGKEITSAEHSAGWDATFSAPKSVSLTGLVRGDDRVRQMHKFVSRLHPTERVLLVGDTRQHESVEAGRIFAQLQESGMKTVRLDEIVRQKDPELKQTVKQLARGEVGLALAGLDRQGRIHEVRGPDERIEAIAKEYAKSPENTLVASPDNRSRTEINQAIHAELQAKGVVSKEEHQIKVLVPRQDLIGADRMWAARYNEADVLRYSRTSHETGIPKRPALPPTP
jgi:hypothetical protein